MTGYLIIYLILNIKLLSWFNHVSRLLNHA